MTMIPTNYVFGPGWRDWLLEKWATFMCWVHR
jgi:hypothetical protein